jgi:nitric oxide reductase large subunit
MRDLAVMLVVIGVALLVACVGVIVWAQAQALDEQAMRGEKASAVEIASSTAPYMNLAVLIGVSGGIVLALGVGLLIAYFLRVRAQKPHEPAKP